MALFITNLNCLGGFQSRLFGNARYFDTAGSELRRILAEKISKQQEKVKQFRKTHGSVVVSNVTIDTMYGGMRGIKSLIWETSELNPEEGIRFRGYTISECQKLLPKAANGNAPLPEGMFWLLLTDDIPTESQVATISADWANRGVLPSHVASMIKNFPSTLHPMAQFSAAITALNCDSNFVQAYSQGKLNKTKYWEYVYEDAMDLIAKLPIIAAKIYRFTYKDGQGSGVIDPKRDWSANFALMMGLDSPDFMELMRTFLTIHCDHEGGNVSAHAVHLVGSALSDPYLAFAAGMNGLAGPLHGRANQEVLIFLNKILRELGNDVTEEQLMEFVKNTLKSGQVIPGFGHALLRVTDPRYTCLREFALKYLPNDPLVKITAKLFKVVPDILKETGKVENPWPNVDAHSGVLLQYYGIKEIQFYTVLFGMSRALGTMASLVWSRALGLPIERPKSLSTEYLMQSLKLSQ